MPLALHAMIPAEEGRSQQSRSAYVAASGVATWLKRTCRAGDLLSQSYA